MTIMKCDNKCKHNVNGLYVHNKINLKRNLEDLYFIIGNTRRLD